MEQKIGEIFEYNGEWYQCIESNSCAECSLFTTECGSSTKSDLAVEVFGSCSKLRRSDNKHVIFKKLEKVGEPYIEHDHSMNKDVVVQDYKLYNQHACYNGHEKILCFGLFGKDGIVTIKSKEPIKSLNCKNSVEIEIKQTKEDMEEKTIKIKREDIKVGSKVIYLPNNRPYVITEANCRMKYDGDWHDCVIYTPLYDNPYKCFVRPIKDFAQNFVLDSAEEKEEKHSNLENTGKNLKPFDLEAAKDGKPVCTRDGRKARIICFDRVTNSTNEYTGRLIVLITNPNGDEQSFYYTEKGNLASEDEYDNHKYDLMMLPEKKEGWVNLYKSSVRSTKEEAMKYCSKCNDYIDTIKIEWEE